MTGRRTGTGGVLLLWAGSILIDLAAVLAIAHDADSDSLVFGRPGTTAVLVVFAVLAVVSAVGAGRKVTGLARLVLAVGQFAAAVLAVVVMFGFFGGDGTKASSVAPLLLYCGFAQAMIGASLLRSQRPADSATRGR